jgi:hypothetical protein
MMEMDSFDVSAAKAFVERFSGEAPEGAVGCRGVLEESFVDR